MNLNRDSIRIAVANGNIKWTRHVMDCVMCKSMDVLEEKFSVFTTVIDDNKVIVIRNVPSLVCRQCGEAYYDDLTAERLEQITMICDDALAEVAIINYQDK